MESREDLARRVAELERQISSLKGGAQLPLRGIRRRASWGIGDIPFYDIAVGPDLARGEVRGHARGVIAIGDIATGFVALGGISSALVACRWASLARSGVWPSEAWPWAEVHSVEWRWEEAPSATTRAVAEPPGCTSWPPGIGTRRRRSSFASTVLPHSAAQDRRSS
jgi:hypothetical protein